MTVFTIYTQISQIIANYVRAVPCAVGLGEHEILYLGQKYQHRQIFLRKHLGIYLYLCSLVLNVQTCDRTERSSDPQMTCLSSQSNLGSNVS